MTLQASGKTLSCYRGNDCAVMKSRKIPPNLAFFATLFPEAGKLSASWSLGRKEADAQKWTPGLGKVRLLPAYDKPCTSSKLVDSHQFWS